MGHVSFTPAGRYGNFLFECATSLAYALKHNLEFSVPLTTSNDFWSPIYLKHLQNKKFNPNIEKVQLWENGHGYQELPFEESWRNKNIYIEGYRQSERYFVEYREQILYLFDFPKEQYDIISLHARYGDYLTVKDKNGKKKHVIVDEPYILSAIELVKDKTGLSRVKVFSDDIPLFKQKHGHLYDFEYSDNKNEQADMEEMSCCHSFINSSSTFSWWGAWLSKNPDKIIVTQREWFNGNWMDLDTSHIVPETWIKL